MMASEPPSHRAVILRRLTQNYEGLAALKTEEIAALDAEIAQATRDGDDDEADVVARGKLQRIRAKCRERVATYERRFVAEYPDSAKLDEALYFLARDLQLSAIESEREGADAEAVKGMRDEAIRVYLDLIKTCPSSPFVAWAYAAYGEFFFNDAARGKVTWGVVREVYERVESSAGASPSAMRAYALLRVGFVEWNSEHLDAAREKLTAARREAESLGADRAARDLVREADAALAQLAAP